MRAVFVSLSIVHICLHLCRLINLLLANPYKIKKARLLTLISMISFKFQGKVKRYRSKTYISSKSEKNTIESLIITYYVHIHLDLVVATSKAFDVISMYKSLFIGNVQ